MLFATLLMLASAQDAPPAAPPETNVAKPATGSDGTQRWSILVDPCASVVGNPVSNEIVVCGSAALDSPRIPLRDERAPPDRPMPSNPNRSGMGALAATGSPCATLSQGCTTGVDLLGGGTALVRLIGKVIDPGSCCETPGEATNPAGLLGDAISGIGGIFKRKPDKSNRIPIPMD